MSNSDKPKPVSMPSLASGKKLYGAHVRTSDYDMDKWADIGGFKNCYNQMAEALRKQLDEQLLAQPIWAWHWARFFRGEMVNSGISIGERKPNIPEEILGGFETSTVYTPLALHQMAFKETHYLAFDQEHDPKMRKL